MLSKQVRFICPHCGAINRAPVRNIGRGGTCIRCNGGVKVPAAHGWGEEPDPSISATIPAGFDEPLESIALDRDLIDEGFEASTADDAPRVELFDVGRPSRASRSITAPSAVVADATVLPTASQIASSDRADRAAVPPVQAIRSLRRFARHGRPRRHVAARRQQPGTPWWAWLAHGTLSAAAMYALAWVYNGSFQPNVAAIPPTRDAFLAARAIDMDSPDVAPPTPTTAPAAPLDASSSAALTDLNGAPNEDAIASVVANTPPDERTWFRYERVLLPNRKQLYSVTRITQGRDGRNRVDKAQTPERPAEFPEDAPIIDRRQAAGGADDATVATPATPANPVAPATADQ